MSLKDEDWDIVQDILNKSNDIELEFFRKITLGVIRFRARVKTELEKLEKEK